MVEIADAAEGVLGAAGSWGLSFFIEGTPQKQREAHS